MHRTTSKHWHRRLSKAHGIHEAILVHGLVALEPCVQRRLNRAITKPLDLACLRAFKAEMEGQAVAPDVQAALDALPAGIKEKVEALLDSLHLCGGYLPASASAAAGLYKHFEEGERVHEIAYGMLRHAYVRLRRSLPDDAGLRQGLRARLHRGATRRQRPVRLRDGGAPGPLPDGRGAGQCQKEPRGPRSRMDADDARGAAAHRRLRAAVLRALLEKFEPDEIAFDEVWKECEAAVSGRKGPQSRCVQHQRAAARTPPRIL